MKPGIKLNLFIFVVLIFGLISTANAETKTCLPWENCETTCLPWENCGEPEGNFEEAEARYTDLWVFTLDEVDEGATAYYHNEYYACTDDPNRSYRRATIRANRMCNFGMSYQDSARSVFYVDDRNRVCMGLYFNCRD